MGGGEIGDRQEEWGGRGRVGIDRSGRGGGSGDRQELGRGESGDRHEGVGWELECG